MLFRKRFLKEKVIPILHKYKIISNVNKSHIKNMYTPFLSEKAFCRHSLCGSMTIEASIVIPLVFFVWMACVAWSSIVRVHTSMQHFLGQTAITISIAASGNDSVIYTADSLWKSFQSLDMANLETGGIEKIYGFDFLGTQIMENESEILLKMRYRIKLLKGVIPIPDLVLSNQTYTRAWTGGENNNEAIYLTEEKQNYVFVSEYGQVYHTDRLCSHIHLTIYMVEEHETRNYQACEKCMNNDVYQGQTFYITEYGEHYHCRLGCSGLKRYVDSMPMIEVNTMGYRPCSRCSGGASH